MDQPNDRRERDLRNLPDLIGQLFGDVSELVRQEFALAREEIRENLTSAQSGLITAGLGAALAFCGLIFLLLAATIGLSVYIHIGYAALAVACAAIIVGVVLLRMGAKRIGPSALTPSRTLRNVRADMEVVQPNNRRP